MYVDRVHTARGSTKEEAGTRHARFVERQTHASVSDAAR